MKNFLKLTAVLCAIALVAVLAIGCGPAENEEQGTVYPLITIEDSTAFESENYGMAMRLDNNELLEAVNAVLTQMIARGYIDQIASKHILGTELDVMTLQVSAVEFTGETATEGYLTMGTNAEFPPFEFRSNAPGAVDGVYGIDVDIARVIAGALGLELRVSDMEFTSIIPAVQTGLIDIGIAGMTITEERAQSVNFSIPYYTAAQVIIARANSGIARATDLVGFTVGVVIGYTGDLIMSEMEGVEIVRSNSGVESVMELINGRVDAVVIDRAPAEAMVLQHQ